MITINKDKCIGCEKCLNNCLMKAIQKTEEGIVGPQACLECGQCIAICPVDAVTMEGYDMNQVVSIPREPVLKTDDVLLAIKARRSIRNYKDQKLTKEELHMLTEAMRYTATGGNRQGSTFVFLQDSLTEFKNATYQFIEDSVKACSEEEMRKWRSYSGFLDRVRKDPEDDYLFRNAPVLVLIATDSVWDAGLQSQNLEHMANAMGMGILYNGFLMRLLNRSEDLKRMAEIEGKSIAAAVLLGYPNVTFERSVPRRPAQVVIK